MTNELNFHWLDLMDEVDIITRLSHFEVKVKTTD